MKALSFPTDPIAHQVSSVGVGIVINDFPINEFSAQTGVGWRIGVDRLGAEIEFGEARHVRQVDAGVDGSPARRCQGGRIIVHEGVTLEGKPIAQARNPVREIEPTTVITYVKLVLD